MVADWGRGYVAVAVEGVETKAGCNLFEYVANWLAGPENLSAHRIEVVERQTASFWTTPPSVAPIFAVVG